MNPPLRKLIWLLPMFLVAVPVATGAERAPRPYYVQLIRADDEERPPTPECKVVGPRLAGQLRPLFRWKSYWEIQQQRVDLAAGQKAKLRLNKDREVEIDLSEPGKRKVTASQGGKTLARNIRKSGEAMTIIGGERDARSVWFIVVRVDKPSP